MSWPFSFLPFLLETTVDTYFEYLRTYSQELGSRIVEMYAPVQGPNDPIAKQVATLLRKPPPAQALTITGLAKHLNRINLFWGLNWSAVARPFSERTLRGNDISTPDLLIGCVDTRAARRSIDEVLSGLGAIYWLDLGNNAASGQYVLGQPLNRANRRKADRLRTVSELYPEIVDAAAGEDDLPSCSAREALERQEPFINQTLAASALAMLSQLFRYGKLGHHAASSTRRPDA